MTILTVGAPARPSRIRACWAFLRDDARHFQIAALATLLGFNVAFLDFGARPLNSALAILAALATQALFSRIARLPAIDLRSPLITGLSLSLLLRADEPWIHALAAAIAIGSKFVLRIVPRTRSSHDIAAGRVANFGFKSGTRVIDLLVSFSIPKFAQWARQTLANFGFGTPAGKHIWNPAGFAIVVLLFAAPDHVWISPGQWGTSVWFAAFVAFLAFMVLNAARRGDIAIFFLASHGALLIARALWLGDPLTIPLHQLQSGSLLIFTFFMISDPRTSPDSRLGRFLFALTVALLAHRLAFFWQMRPALYVALIALSPLTLLIDRILPAERFAWTRPAQQGAAR
jgi:Na+-translocating ferredoxin:NAD+ oxidoreductase RnfD subunit